MRRSFILTGLVVVCLPILAGCNGTTASFFKDRPFKLFSVPVDTSAAPASSQPAVASAEDPKANSEEKAETEDPSVAKVNDVVAQFVARFPPADLNSQASSQSNRNTATDHVATTQPTVAEGTPKIVHPPVTSAPAESAVTAKPEIASAEPAGPAVEPKINANTSVNIEEVASPKPPQPAEPTATDNVPQIEIVDVQPAAEQQPADVPAETAANQPTQQVQESQSGDVTKMITQLEEAVRLHPQQMDDQFKLRLLYLATGQKDRAVATFKDVDPVQAEILSALFRTVAGAQNALRDPSKEAGQALGAASDLQRVLSELSPVVIWKMALVTAVNSFGDYKAVNPPLFEAGRPIHVFCYCEIGNLHSEPTQDGRLRTFLAAALEVYDPTGKIVWQQKIPQIEDLVYTPRRDFFLPLEIKLPATLSPGEYVLKVTIEDKLGATTDQQRLTFTIGK